MNVENFMTMYFFLGLFLTWGFALFINEYMAAMIKEQANFPPPEGINPEDWKKAFEIPEDRRKPNKYLGFFEATLFFISFYVNQYELIGGWLTFKLASKWQTWNAIMKIPERIEGVDIIAYIGAKNHIAWFTLQRWLLGTLANIIAGLFGLIGGAFVMKILNIFVKVCLCCHM